MKEDPIFLDQLPLVKIPRVARRLKISTLVCFHFSKLETEAAIRNCGCTQNEANSYFPGAKIS